MDSTVPDLQVSSVTFACSEVTPPGKRLQSALQVLQVEMLQCTAQEYNRRTPALFRLSFPHIFPLVCCAHATKTHTQGSGQ